MSRYLTKDQKRIFNARRYASAVYVVIVCLCVCLSVSLTHADIASKRLNLALCKQRGLFFSGLRGVSGCLLHNEGGITYQTA